MGILHARRSRHRTHAHAPDLPDPSTPPGTVALPRLLALAAILPPGGPRGADLTPIAALIGTGLGATSVVLQVFGNAEPQDHRWTAPQPPSGSGAQLYHPIRFHQAEVGAMALDLPAAPSSTESLTEGLGHHLDELAAVLGVVVAGVRADLLSRSVRHRIRDRAEQVADVRYRAASQMESERYALERDLHDGAQLHLVSLQMTAAVLEHHLAAGTAADHRLHAALTDLGGKLDRTHRLLADTAEGVAPIPLRNEGLAPALAERFGTAGGVTLLIEPAVRARRYPPTVENAVYFTCLEAVSNAHKHAPGAAITVSLRDTYHGLWFAIEDSGPGLDDSADLGPHHLQARISAVGGSLEVTSSRAAGTRVAGLVPI